MIAPSPLEYVISVCVITLGRPVMLEKCLNSLVLSLKSLPRTKFEVIVSDDCTNKSAYSVVSKFQGISWVQGPSRGVAANRNNVIRAASGKWIIFIDDDEIVDEQLISSFYQAIISNQWDVLEGRVQPVAFPDSILWYAPCIKSGGAYCTANLAIKRSLLYKLGGFNENFTVSHEDVELGKRIRESKVNTKYIDEAIVYHPARKYALTQVWKRMIDLQCQSYIHQQVSPGEQANNRYFDLFIFCVKYWVRVIRFELDARLAHQWRRQLQVALLLLLTSPVAFIRLVQMIYLDSP